MNRRDRAKWRTANSLADLGELTAQWCEGTITQTPGHLGPPDAETVPYLGLLAALNRTGQVVTTNSQAAGSHAWPGLPEVTSWNAWVVLFAERAWVDRHVGSLTDPWLTVRAMPRRAWRDEVSFYRDRITPAATVDLLAARYIWICDPTPGRNDRLWPALQALATIDAPRSTGI
jgi:hypothetical protein